MIEKRKYNRLFLIHYLRILNSPDFNLLGYLADITPHGMMTISGVPQKLDATFKVKMRLPEDLFGRNEVSFHIKSIWCQRYLNTRFYSTGYQLQDTPEEDINLINSLIQKLSLGNMFCDDAVKFYKGLDEYNCAQAILKSLEGVFEIKQQSIRKYGSFGSGEAEDGTCGALFAAKSLLRDQQNRKKLTQRFLDEVGATSCEEIIKFGYLSCAGCVYVAHRILQEMIETGVELRSPL